MVFNFKVIFHMSFFFVFLSIILLKELCFKFYDIDNRILWQVCIHHIPYQLLKFELWKDFLKSWKIVSIFMYIPWKNRVIILYSNSKTQHPPIFIFPEIDWSFLKIVFYSTLNSTNCSKSRKIVQYQKSTGNISTIHSVFKTLFLKL